MGKIHFTAQQLPHKKDETSRQLNTLKFTLIVEVKDNLKKITYVVEKALDYNKLGNIILDVLNRNHFMSYMVSSRVAMTFTYITRKTRMRWVCKWICDFDTHPPRFQCKFNFWQGLHSLSAVGTFIMSPFNSEGSLGVENRYLICIVRYTFCQP